MNLAKPVRIEDKNLLESVKQQPCAATGRLGTDWDPIDPHHITTKGARGGDTQDNVIPLLRSVHTEWHAKGLSHILKKYPRVKIWLDEHGREDILDLLKRKMVPMEPWF